MSFRKNLKKGIALRLEEKLLAAKRAGLLEFHLPGQHDQKTHGNWAGPEVEGDIDVAPATRKAGAGVRADGFGNIPKMPEGGFPASDYDKKGKPVPGTDAWLHAHGISRAVYEDRPYVRFPPGDASPESKFAALPQELQDIYNKEPEAKRQLLNMMKEQTNEFDEIIPGSGGGLIMSRTPVPGIEQKSPEDEHIVPQTRPDVPVVTNKSARAYAQKTLESAKARTEQMKALSGKDDLIALQEGRVAHAQEALEKAKTIDRDGYLEFARNRVAEAQKRFEEDTADLPRRGTKQFDRKNMTAEQIARLDEAKSGVTKAEKSLADAEKKANYNFGDPERDSPEVIAERTEKYREVTTRNAEKALGRAQDKLGRIQALDADGVREQIDSEISVAEDIQRRAQNKFDKTAAKYLFPPNPPRLQEAIDKGQILGKAGRVDTHGDANIDALVNGRGRVYLAMEGNIKEDALISAVARELEPGAAVISVPSVTLWRHEEMQKVAERYLNDGREVVLIPDADGVNNPRVRNEARAMQALLEGAGAKVLVAPPPIPLKDGKPIFEQKIDKKTGEPVFDKDGKPVYGTKVAEFENVIPGSPKGTKEHLKGVDDYLGLGATTPPHPETGERAMGVLGNLAVQRRVTPEIDLAGVVDAAGVANAERALKAISLINGSTEIKVRGADGKLGKDTVTVASGKIGTEMLSAAMGKFNDHGNAARRSIALLEKAGVIKVERIYDEEAYSRGIRQIHPDMTEARIDQLVRAGVIERPAFGDDDTRPVEFGDEERPIISILKPEYMSRDQSPVSLNSLGTHDTSAARIRSLYSSGLTYSEIADVLGVSNTTIKEAIG